MSIKYAILGILSWKSSTGYELKKIFEDSSILYWSGNNNQIYKALLEMQENMLVTSQVIHQESSPSKKIYTITEEGRKELKEWVVTLPEAPEIKKSFLVQLAWSDMLSSKELHQCFSNYEKELLLHLVMEQEKSKRALHSPNRTPREALLWEMISDNIIKTYKTELIWLQETRKKLIEHELIEEMDNMNYEIREMEHTKYIELISATNQIRTEDDALDLIALCWEHETYLIMIHYESLANDFFQLKTKAAGNIIQKFINYNIKTVAVIPEELMQNGRFKEMALEINKGNHFRMYGDKVEAEKWLLA